MNKDSVPVTRVALSDLRYAGNRCGLAAQESEWALRRPRARHLGPRRAVHLSKEETCGDHEHRLPSCARSKERDKQSARAGPAAPSPPSTTLSSPPLTPPPPPPPPAAGPPPLAETSASNSDEVLPVSAQTWPNGERILYKDLCSVRAKRPSPQTVAREERARPVAGARSRGHEFRWEVMTGA